MGLNLWCATPADLAVRTVFLAAPCRMLLVAWVAGAANGCVLSASGQRAENVDDDAGSSPSAFDGGARLDAPWTPGGDGSNQGRDSGAMSDSAAGGDSGVPVGDSATEPWDGEPWDGGGQTDGGDQHWWNRAYGWRLPVRVVHVPPSDVDHMPLLVRLCEPEFPHAQARSGGGDLRFVTAEGQVLASEIETWNRNGCSFIWVGLPSLRAPPGNNDFWLYFGNGSPADQPPAPAQVWDTGFRGVWHLAEDVSAGDTGASHYDSTGYGNHGRQERNGLSTRAGAAGGAQNLTRTDDRIVIPSAGFRTTGNRLTIEVRMAPASLETDDNIFGAGNSSAVGVERGRYWQIYWNGSHWVARLRIEGTNTHALAGPYDLWATNWRHLAVVYDGATMSLFVDGAQQGTYPVSGSLSAIDTDFIIGNNPILARDFRGHVDEVRISHVARSEAYLAATSACLQAGCTSVGDVEALSR